jgi:hypothetical protein
MNGLSKMKVCVCTRTTLQHRLLAQESIFTYMTFAVLHIPLLPLGQVCQGEVSMSWYSVAMSHI